MLIWPKDDVTRIARLLSCHDQGNVRVRRATERMTMRTPDAVWLYRIRDVQCDVATAAALRAGEVPATDLRIPWLAARGPDVTLDEWKQVEERFADSVVALDRWWDAGKIWQDLILVPDEARTDWIVEEETCDYLVACFALAVEERHRVLGGETGVESAWLAVRIADQLLDRHGRGRPEPSMNGKLAASVLTDLLALAWARLANAYRILGRIPEANSAMSKALVVEHLDAYRDAYTAEVATTNLLAYLVREGRIRRAVLSRHTLPWPTLPAQVARRLCVEGCIWLALGRPDFAEVFLADAAVRLTDLRRFFDAVLALLYLASACYRRESPRDAHGHLAAALHLARTCGHPIVGKIEQLIQDLEATPDPASEIEQIAFEAGGCLSPVEAEAKATD